MHSQFLMVAFLATYGIAVPLNINLGAYSPALVVGDGEISFGGNADVESLMNALEGAAVSGAAANGEAAAPAARPAAAPAAEAPVSAAVRPVQPAVQGEQTAQVASLQGLGKEIAPRVVTMEAGKKVLKRDLAGFNAALAFATNALTNGPEVQLGTEESGVGIIVHPKSGEAAGEAAAPIERRAKRDEPKLKTTITTMFIRGGPAPAGPVARSPVDDASISLSKRTASPGIDALNLNMAEGQVAELTFVEMRAVDDDEDDEE